MEKKVTLRTLMRGMAESHEQHHLVE